MVPALHSTPDPAMGGSTSEARAAAQESIRMRILAMRQAKQAQMRAMQPESDEDGLGALRAHEAQVPAASLLSVPRPTPRGRALVSDARFGGSAVVHSWYAESDADDDEEDDEEVLAERRALFEAADDESTIHGHQPAPSQMRAPVARPRNACSTAADSGLSDYPLSSSTASRSDTSASARSSYAQPAEAQFSRERASTLLDELAAELQAQRACSPAPAAPSARPPASSSGSKGLSSARSSLTSQSSDGVASGSRPLLVSLANSGNRSSAASGLSTPLSPAISSGNSFNGSLSRQTSSAGLSRQASSVGSVSRRVSSVGPPSAPPPDIALPSLPPAPADRRLSTASSATSAVSRWSVRSDLPPMSEAVAAEASTGAALPPQWVEELNEDSDEALSDVLNISPRDSPAAEHAARASSEARDCGDDRLQDAGALSPPLSEDERRRQSLLRKSMGGLVAALTSEAAGWKQEQDVAPLPSRPSPATRAGDAQIAASASDAGPARAETKRQGIPSTTERPLLTPEPPTRPGSGATAIVDMYQSSRGSGSASDSAPNADARAPHVSDKGQAPSATPMVPAISIDEAESDTLSEGSGRGSPRKRRKQKKSKAHGLAFDDQRVQAPGSSSRGQPGPTAAQEAAQWAYYAFSPDLPPFVPPGMRPTDLTGRGTWRSIAARAGTLDTLPSRGSTLTLGSIVSMDEQLGGQPSSSGPVSMRELAAQARAKAERANALRERQHQLLAQRSFLPIDIHTHATEHALSERGSYAGSSASSIFSFDSSLRPRDSDLYSIASDETLGIRSAPAFPQPPARTESGAGTDVYSGADALVGLGIGPSSRQAPAKQYVEFSMQTSPTGSPVASPVLAASRVDMGVGVDSPEVRRARRNANLLSASHALQGWRDDDNDAAAGGEARGSNLMPERSRNGPVVRRSKSFGLAPRRAGSQSRVDALDLDSPGAWPPVLSAPRLSSRSSVATFDRSSARLSRSPSIASFASGAISESTIGPESDAESDESDLDVAVSLDLLADRSGALDASPLRGEKRKHQQQHGASKIEALGERRIASAPRKSGAFAHAARLRLRQSSGWSSPESEDELPASGRFAGAGQRARARPSAPAAFAECSTPPTASRTSAPIRHAASAVELRENTRARASHAAVSPLRAASPVLDLTFSDGDSLLHSDIEALPDLDEDEFMLQSRARAARSDAATSAEAAGSLSGSSVSPDALAAKLHLVHASSSETETPSTDSTAEALTAREMPFSPLCPRRPDSADLEDTPNTLLGSDVWSAVGDRRSTATTATTCSEGSAGDEHTSGAKLLGEPEAPTAVLSPRASAAVDNKELAILTPESAPEVEGNEQPPAIDGQITPSDEPKGDRAVDAAQSTSSPASQLRAPAAKPSGIRPPTTPARRGSQAASSVASPSPASFIAGADKEKPVAVRAASGIPAPSGIRRAKSFGSHAPSSYTSPPLSTLPTLAGRKSSVRLSASPTAQQSAASPAPPAAAPKPSSVDSPMLIKRKPVPTFAAAGAASAPPSALPRPAATRRGTGGSSASSSPAPSLLPRPSTGALSRKAS